MYNYVWAIFFNFSKFVFFSKNEHNAKIIPLIFFVFSHITIIISITLKCNFNKKKRYMNMYGQISYDITHV